MSFDPSKPIFRTKPRAPLITDYARWQEHFEYAMQDHYKADSRLQALHDQAKADARVQATYQCLAEQGQLRVQRLSNVRTPLNHDGIPYNEHVTTIFDMEGHCVHHSTGYMTARDMRWKGKETIEHTEPIDGTNLITIHLIVSDKLPDFNEFCDESGYPIDLNSDYDPFPEPRHIYEIVIDRQYVEDNFQ